MGKETLERNRQLRWSIIEVESDLIAEGITQTDYEIVKHWLTCQLPEDEKIRKEHEAMKPKIFWHKRGGHD